MRCSHVTVVVAVTLLAAFFCVDATVETVQSNEVANTIQSTELTTQTIGVGSKIGNIIDTIKDKIKDAKDKNSKGNKQTNI